MNEVLLVIGILIGRAWKAIVGRSCWNVFDESKDVASEAVILAMLI